MNKIVDSLRILGAANKAPEYYQCGPHERELVESLAMLANVAADEIERLELGLKEARAVVLSAETEAHANHLRTNEVEAQAAAMREALEWAFPFASYHSLDQDNVDAAKAALSTAAGRKMQVEQKKTPG